MNTTLKVQNMMTWTTEEWAAFSCELWQLRGDIETDLNYLSVAIDILTDLRDVVLSTPMPMRIYIADLADELAALSCGKIRKLADDCRWRSTQSNHSITEQKNRSADESTQCTWEQDDTEDDLPY